MSRDIHKKPFDDGTKAKLTIFRGYLKEWLPVFLKKKVAFFFKQWGGKNKKATGRILNGKTYDEMPEILLQESV